MTIYLQYHDPDQTKLDKISIGDWIDLRAADRDRDREGRKR